MRWFIRHDKKLKEVSTESEHGLDKSLKDSSVKSEHRTDKRFQKGMIITDDISFSPILDFDDYVTSLTKIIKNSYPKFSIGIYGEWGTGKTTLMRSIFNRLKDNNEDNSIIPVWFNAWRYEREEQFAIIPLLKTIAYAIPEDRKELKDLKEKLKKGGMNFLKKIPDIIPSIAGHYFGEGARNVTDEMIKSFKEQFIPKLELLSEVDKETIYFDGLDNISAEMQKIRDINESFKIVVFVDDLDRCSPEKALQVLESIKVFLDSDGFIYVIGLSFNKISQLITAYYKDKYKDVGIEGDQYLKKIIQIPIILSDWNSEDIKTLIQDFIDNKVIENEDYQKIIKENIGLISSGLEENPRETKRFLNNFIVAQEIFSKKGTKPKELLVLQILNMRWNEIYRLIVNSHGRDLDILNTYLDDTEELKKLSLKKPEDADWKPSYRVLQKFTTDEALWSFLKDNYSIMRGISDWKVYRRATKIGEEPATESALDKYEIYGNIHDSRGIPVREIVVHLFEHDFPKADLLGASTTDSLGNFRFIFNHASFIELGTKGTYTDKRTFSVYLTVEDPNHKFSDVRDTQYGKENMYVQLPKKNNYITWKGNIFEISPKSPNPYEINFAVRLVEESERLLPLEVPARVTGLKVTPLPKQIKLEWDRNPETDVDYYNIYRGEKPLNMVTIVTSQPTTYTSRETSYIDRNILPNKDYYYRVTAVNKDGIIGPFSAELSAKIGE
jgi:GTPase SAR1 family protein